MYCETCSSKVRLEQDGRTCSNCGTDLISGEPPKRPRTHDILTQPKPEDDKKPHHRYPVVAPALTSPSGNSPVRPAPPPPEPEEKKPSARRSRRSATK